jgi:FkbM family methyltransferase
MMNRRPALNQQMSTKGLTYEMASVFYHEFFRNQDYTWFHRVEPGDVCVDVGACCGMFTAHALDEGASKVYMVEGSRELLKVAIENVSEYMMNEPVPKVYPVNCLLGDCNPTGVYETPTDDLTVDSIDRMSLMELVDHYDIQYIDYLKMDIEGNEFDTLTAENLDFFKRKVGHFAGEIHTQAFDGAQDKFLEFRDTFLKPLMENPAIKINAQIHGQNKTKWLNNILWDDQAIRDLTPDQSYFMLYITNEW